MKKKLGTIICMTSNQINGRLFLTADGVLTANYHRAKTYNASGKVLNGIVARAQEQYPAFTATKVERWEVD